MLTNQINNFWQDTTNIRASSLSEKLIRFIVSSDSQEATDSPIVKYAEALVQKVDKIHKLLPPATRQGNIFTPVCDSVYGGVSVQGRGLCPGGVSEVFVRGVSGECLCPGGVSVQGGLCPGGVFVQGASFQRAPLFSGVSVQGGSLSRGSLYQGDPSPASRLRAGGTHPTGMHVCSNSGQFKKVKF